MCYKKTQENTQESIVIAFRHASLHASGSGALYIALLRGAILSIIIQYFGRPVTWKTQEMKVLVSLREAAAPEAACSQLER
jgi:hypothetical protein